MPRSTAYWRQRGFVYSKISMQTRPTADATRRQYPRSSSKVRKRGRSRSISTPSITSSSGCLGSLKASMWGARAAPCGVRGCRAPVARRQLVAPAGDRRGRRAPRSLGAQLPRPLVHVVVNGPAEVPHGDDGAALVLRKYHERVIEIRVAAGHGDAQAGCGRPQATAPQRRAGTSEAPRVGPGREDVEPGLLEAVENAHPAEPGESQFVAEAAAQAVADGRARRRTTGASVRPFPRGRPARRPTSHGRRGPLRCAPKRSHSSRGTYRRPLQPVALEVLPEVGELERRAHRVGSAIERVGPRAPATRSTSRPTGFADRRQ